MNVQLRDQRLRTLGAEPGVYLMKNQYGGVIYVGKAASLRSRVRSYFGTTRGMDHKTRELVSNIVDFEVIRTDTPSEALILENELIKRYQPKYNVMLRDDKSYPFIRITNEPFPRVISTRRVVNDGSRYFGPFTSAASVNRTLDSLNKLFPYRLCDIEITGEADRPCLYYHIGRCNGPCIGVVGQEEYGQVIQNVQLFLEGRSDEFLPELREQMERAADALDFEQAARLRDEIKAIEHVLERQKITSSKRETFDVLALAKGEGGDACVQVSTIREGKMLGSEHFLMTGARVDDEPSHILGSFVTQFYGEAALVPRELVLQYPIDDEEIVQTWLGERRGGPVKLTIPRRGTRKHLVEMVAKSAEENLNHERVRWLNDEQRTTMALTELGDRLQLERLPRRIECYDISNLQGDSPVASMVVFEDGRPKKSDYRRFGIKDVEGPNDYAMMQEVLRRRFKRAHDLESTQEWRELPDLVIVDGGKGQLNSALAVFEELDVNVPVVGLAKENEEIFLPGERDPIILPRDAQSLYLVQRVRDEAHRFAVTFHRSRRKKSSFSSALDSVRGLGPQRKKALLRTFGSVKKIREASVDDLSKVDGIGQSLASQIKSELGSQ
jgi:excinuclease ABC subunit C